MEFEVGAFACDRLRGRVDWYLQTGGLRHTGSGSATAFGVEGGINYLVRRLPWAGSLIGPVLFWKGIWSALTKHQAIN